MDSEDITSLPEKRPDSQHDARVRRPRTEDGNEHDMLVRAASGMDDPTTYQA